jgi:hypothetical protein
MPGPCEQLVHLVAELRRFFVFANRDSRETNRLPLVSCCQCVRSLTSALFVVAGELMREIDPLWRRETLLENPSSSHPCKPVSLIIPPTVQVSVVFIS